MREPEYSAPVNFVAALTMDRLGRKPIQVILVVPFLIIYEISYFFTEFGPNATTFIYPTEVFPVAVRTTGHGVASAAGKVGAFVGVFLFPIMMARDGLAGAEAMAALASVLGLAVTVFLLPETKGLTLEELSEQAVATAR
jgi:uncharacterized membrane protein YeaQ/YmgE (transglycosylase-associated protein family)